MIEHFFSHLSSFGSRKFVQATLIFSFLLSGLVLLLLLFESSSQIYQVIRTVFGSVFLLFLPGYRLTICFFDSSEIDLLERIALSFALSISVIPLLVFYLNLAGVPISALMIRAVVSVVIFLSFLYIRFFVLRKKV